MNWKGYEIGPYRPEDGEQVVSVSRSLWKSGDELNSRYVVWKHEGNPLAAKPASIVARYQGQVVGFLGLVPGRWRVRGKEIKILQGADIVVHPEHQGKWLASALIRAGIKLHAGEYVLYLALTPNRNAIPVLLRLGWRELGVKRYLRHMNLPRLARRVFVKGNGGLVDYGIFGGIEVSPSPRVEDMSRIDLSNSVGDSVINTIRSADYLRWRFANPKAEFVYLYSRGASGIDAYLVLSLNGAHAHVFDYAEEAGTEGLKKVLSFAVHKTRFVSLSLMDTTVRAGLLSFLHRKWFFRFDAIDRYRDRRSYRLPLLVRPTAPKCVENDWVVDGIDVRDARNWHLTEMCLD